MRIVMRLVDRLMERGTLHAPTRLLFGRGAIKPPDERVAVVVVDDAHSRSKELVGPLDKLLVPTQVVRDHIAQILVREHPRHRR